MALRYGGLLGRRLRVPRLCKTAKYSPMGSEQKA